MSYILNPKLSQSDLEKIAKLKTKCFLELCDSVDRMVESKKTAQEKIECLNRALPILMMAMF